jgi:hypothetical protein
MLVRASECFCEWWVGRWGRASSVKQVLGRLICILGVTWRWWHTLAGRQLSVSSLTRFAGGSDVFGTLIPCLQMGGLSLANAQAAAAAAAALMPPPPPQGGGAGASQPHNTTGGGTGLPTATATQWWHDPALAFGPAVDVDMLARRRGGGTTTTTLAAGREVPEVQSAPAGKRGANGGGAAAPTPSSRRGSLYSEGRGHLKRKAAVAVDADEASSGTTGHALGHPGDSAAASPRGNFKVRGAGCCRAPQCNVAGLPGGQASPLLAGLGWRLSRAATAAGTGWAQVGVQRGCQPFAAVALLQGAPSLPSALKVPPPSPPCTALCSARSPCALAAPGWRRPRRAAAQPLPRAPCPTRTSPRRPCSSPSAPRSELLRPAGPATHTAPSRGTLLRAVPSQSRLWALRLRAASRAAPFGVRCPSLQTPCIPERARARPLCNIRLSLASLAPLATAPSTFLPKRRADP